jgi:hypothetical protein
MRKQLALIAAAAALLGAASSAQAYLVLTIVDSGVAGSARTCDLTFWDGTANYCDTLPNGHVGFNIVDANNVSFSGTIGKHLVSTTSGSALETATLAILDTSSTSVRRNSAGAGDLQINMTGFGYTSPTAAVKTFEGNASYTSSSFAPGDTVRSDFWVDPSDSGAPVNNLNCVTNITSGFGGCTAGALNWTDTAFSSFSIRSVQTYNVAVGGTVNVTSTGIVRNKIPEPATLSLVGLALVGAGFAGRRAAKKA